jgi:hypothetical protein
MADDIIKSVERGGADMPSQPVATDRRGNVIGDGPSYYNNNPQEAAEDDDDLPGLLLENQADDIPGVGTNEESVEITGVDDAQDEPVAEIETGVGIDDLASTPIEEFPLVEEP